jgi:hypothetical protein
MTSRDLPSRAARIPKLNSGFDFPRTFRKSVSVSRPCQLPDNSVQSRSCSLERFVLRVCVDELACARLGCDAYLGSPATHRGQNDSDP